MTYQETIDWMFSQLPMYQRQGKTAFKKDLTNISAFCDELKNPQNKFASIHVGGTNGKGSTSHIISVNPKHSAVIALMVPPELNIATFSPFSTEAKSWSKPSFTS